jgi:hypothetical protein
MRSSFIIVLTASMLILAIGLQNASGKEAGESLQGTLRVELDAYSGMENPEWNLTAEEEEAFLKRLRALNTTGEEFVRIGLGYRGLVVDGAGLEGYDRVSIYNGVVLAQAGNSSWRFDDEGRMLERWLLGTGNDSLDRWL